MIDEIWFVAMAAWLVAGFDLCCVVILFHKLKQLKRDIGYDERYTDYSTPTRYKQNRRRRR